MSKHFFSAPGRIEIGGNHTDHQRGRVLAAAVDLETTATAVANGSNIVRLSGAAPGAPEIDLGELDARDGEKGTAAGLIRGIAAWFADHHYPVGGFDAELLSSVPIGEGLSSSAAFEVLIASIFKRLFGAVISSTEIALAGQFAENNYFGKPCGLMDQTASVFGGLNIIDFAEPLKPLVTPVNAELSGYRFCVVATGDSHADLTPDYTAITDEMKAVAEYFGKGYLSEISAEEFYSSISRLRRLGDRAVLRAIHYFAENERVLKQAAALENKDMSAFFELVIESGRSSLAYLQNVYSLVRPQRQGLTLALALSEKILAGKGAWRVHGGGFAGTVLSVVPDELIAAYSREMSIVFGEGCCRFLNIRKEGGF